MSDVSRGPDSEPPAEPEEITAPKKSGSGRRARKDRVLHTRVPVVLEQELKRLATSLRVPVSNVVRAILEDAIDTVDVVSARAEGELRGVASVMRHERDRLRKRIPSAPPRTAEPPPPEPPAREQPAPAAPLAGAIGYAPIVLVGDAVCAVTGRAMSAGDEAFIVHFADSTRTVLIRRDALPKPV